MDELYRKLLAQLEEGQDTVLAFITEGDGSIPRTTGAYMLVGREGRIFGTIGGGNLEYQAVLHAQELVQEKKSEYREYDLGTGEGKGLGMVCGGRVKVYFYFMNGAHGEAESLAQALAAQEQYRSYWIFFALDGTGIRVLEKEAWEMLPAAQEKAGHCRILELDGKRITPRNSATTERFICSAAAIWPRNSFRCCIIWISAVSYSMTGRNMWTKHCSRTPGRPCWWILRNWTRFFRSGKMIIS